MSSAERLAVLEDTQRNELESLLMDFDQAWSPSLLGTFCTPVTSHSSESFRSVALVELVKIDLHRQWSAGIARMLDDYLREFPTLGTTDSVDADLIVAEYEARRSVDPQIALAGYESRFPKQFQQVKTRASQLLDSGVTDYSTPKRTERESIQASIDTSRIDDSRDTKAGNRNGASDELPVEFGRYRIIKELGSGAMGKVYLAHDSQLDRQIALKTPSFRGSHDDDLVTRFYREARAAAKIQHRNICPVYDVGEIDGRHFISMAFVKGRCMSEFIKPEQLPPAKTSAILVQRLALALAEAHRHNVIHRDLKPANIMIDLSKEPIVMDFGLARQTDVESRVTQSGMAVGTPAYMSPEQIRGDVSEVGATADIYALGVILYELLTGELPFRGPIAKVAYSIVHEEPVAPSQLRDGIDPKLEAICAKMMVKQREQRYQSMDDVATELKNYLDEIKQPTTISSPHRSAAQRWDSDSEPLTETDALNAFFAARASQDLTNTVIESPAPEVPQHALRPRTQVSPTRGSGRTKWIVCGLGGFLLLAGVSIYFSDGTRVEIEDGTEATVETNPNGTLKSITTKTTPDSSVPTPAVGNQDSQELAVSPLASAPAGADTGAENAGESRITSTQSPAAIDRLEVITIKTVDGTASMAISPSAQLVASTGDGTPRRISIWDTHTGQRVSRYADPCFQDSTHNRLAYSPDGKWLLCSSGPSFSVVSAEDGKEISRLEFPARPAVVVFPRRTLALALFHESEVHRTKRGGVAQRIRIWNWRTNETLYEENFPFENGAPNSFPAVSPDERYLTLAREHHHVRYRLSVDGDHVSIDSPLAMETTSRVRGPLVFSADGKYAATSVKSKACMAAVLDIETGRIVSLIDPESAASSNDGHQYGCSLGFTADGSGIASADHTGRVAFWDVKSGQLIRELGRFTTSGNHQPPQLAMTADDRVLVGGDQSDPRITIQQLE